MLEDLNDVLLYCVISGCREDVVGWGAGWYWGEVCARVRIVIGWCGIVKRVLLL